MPKIFSIAAIFLVGGMTAAATVALAQVNDRTSPAAAAAGQGAFSQYCAACHTPGEAAGLMLRGAEDLGELHQTLAETMPPAGLPRPNEAGYRNIVAFLSASAGGAESGGEQLAWSAWRGDSLGTGFSPARQIDAANAGELEIAWRWTSANFGPRPETRSITTPLMAEGRLYATAGTTRNVVAIDPASGQTLWMWRPDEGEDRYDNAPRKGAGRGLAYWPDANGGRIFTVTPGFHLAALEAATGRPVERFGAGGIVDLMEGLSGAPEDGLPDIGLQSPPLVIGDVVVVGSAHVASIRPNTPQNVKGEVRGYDAVTGALLWSWRAIPEADEPGYETWAPGTAETTGNAGVWAPMSADPETGAIFLPVEAATSDFYGGERLGDNRNSTSLVSLDSRTGEVRWAQQLIRHDIWDWDTPAIPILADIPASGETIKAVAQITKQGFVYVFERNTGEPLWPMQEVAVPASDVPGEVAAATQRFPTKPAPFERQGVNEDDLIDFTPQLRAEAINAVEDLHLGAFMQPPSLQNAPDGTRGTLSLPGIYGGGNWEGGAYDPQTGLLFIGSQTSPTVLSLAETPEDWEMPYRYGGGRVPTVQGLPLIKPPWGRITAIDLTTGEHVWQVANAATPKEVAEHPALAFLDLAYTGVSSRAGLLVTPTAVFAGEGISGGPLLHVMDKATGVTMALIDLPGPQTGLPMTYVHEGRQYIVMAVSIPGGAAELVALALPE
jgi:glucose dehydrogenase